MALSLAQFSLLLVVVRASGAVARLLRPTLAVGTVLAAPPAEDPRIDSGRAWPVGCAVACVRRYAGQDPADLVLDAVAHYIEPGPPPVTQQPRSR